VPKLPPFNPAAVQVHVGTVVAVDRDGGTFAGADAAGRVAANIGAAAAGELQRAGIRAEDIQVAGAIGQRQSPLLEPPGNADPPPLKLNEPLLLPRSQRHPHY
jgi:hypothetical protein